jgi:hypothetical protein
MIPHSSALRNKDSRFEWKDGIAATVRESANNLEHYDAVKRNRRKFENLRNLEKENHQKKIENEIRNPTKVSE